MLIFPLTRLKLSFELCRNEAHLTLGSGLSLKPAKCQCKTNPAL